MLSFEGAQFMGTAQIIQKLVVRFSHHIQIPRVLPLHTLPL